MPPTHSPPVQDLELEELARLLQRAIAAGGGPLDLPEICSRFLRTLQIDYRLAFASVWIHAAEQEVGPYELAFAHPSARATEKRIPRDHPIAIEMTAARTIDADHATATDKGYITESAGPGWMTVIPLPDIGFVKLIGSTPDRIFTERQRLQNEPIFAHFAASVRGCLNHRRALDEVSERRKAEAELTVLTRQLNRLIGALPYGILVVDGDGKIRHVNQGFCDLFGIAASPNRLLGLEATEAAERTSRLFPEPAEFLAATAEVAAKSQPSEREILRLRDQRVLARSFQPIELGEADLGYLWLYRDVTAEQKRDDDLSKLSLVASRTDNAVIITDRDGITEWVNEAFTRMTSYEPEEAIGMKPGELLQGPETDPETRREIGEAVRSGTGFEGQILNYTKHGATYWLNITITPIFDDQGELVRFIAIESDCTERLEADEKLRGSEERMRLLLSNVLDSVIEADENGLITSWNGQAESTFGWSAEEVIGEPLNDLISPADEREARLERVRARIESDDPLVKTPRVETTFQRRSGEIFPAEFTLYPIQHHGQTMFTAFVRDITERHLVDRMKDELVSTVSHELRTPLTGLQGFVQLLLENDYPAAKRREFLEVVQAETQRLGRLIDDFLDLQRIEGGQLRYGFQNTDLAELITESARLYSTGPDRQQVYTDIDEDLPAVRADPDRLRQVLRNLLSNAAKFSAPDTEILITAEWIGKRLRVSVEDQGCGIPSENLAQIFERFYRVESFDAQATGGSGLGLPIVQRIIDDHGGTIDVRSEVGKGSVFTFELPIARGGDTTGAQ